MIFERQGVKIGVIGVMVAMVTPNMRTQAASSYLWDDPAASVAKAIGELSEPCDILVVLSHLGQKNDELLAQSVPGIHLIVGGHTHSVLSKPAWVGSTAIVQAGSHGRFVGRVVLDNSGKVLSGELLPLSID